MGITVVGLAALAILRELRGTDRIPLVERTCACAPHAPGRRRWNRAAVERYITKAVGRDVCSHLPVIEVATTDRDSRLRCRGVTSHLATGEQNDWGFVDVGEGLRVASPELVYIQMTEHMPLPVQLMLGSELSGCYSRDAVSPREGDVSFGLEPITCKEMVLALLRRRGRLPHRDKVGQAVDHMVEYAWSPMESVLATMLELPRELGGYGMGPLRLNRELEMYELGDHETRIPDILFGFTGVGINYEGEPHMPTGELLSAAEKAAANPSPRAMRELEDQARRMRAKIVDDKRRDRELMEYGMKVITMTKDDLNNITRLDREIYELHRLVCRSARKPPLSRDEFLGDASRTRLRTSVLGMIMARRNVH